MVAVTPQRTPLASYVGRSRFSCTPLLREASMAIRWNAPLRGSVLPAAALAHASPRRRDGGATASVSSQIARLSVNGQVIQVDGTPNQTVLLPNGTGKVVINEQTSGGAGDITVNALHVSVDGVADVIISSAHADITCAPAPPPLPPPGCTPADFITGGGWITGTPSGAKANFGVAGGIKQGTFWGHLTYNDHGSNGPQVKGTGVTGYTT